MEKDGNAKRVVDAAGTHRSRVSKAEEPLSAVLDERGHEVVSSTPMAPPVGYKKEPTVTERIRAMVRSEMLRREAEEAGVETFEEADDFDTPDDPVDPSTPYEEVFDPPPVVAEPARTPPVGGAPADAAPASAPTADPPKPDPAKA